MSNEEDAGYVPVEYGEDDIGPFLLESITEGLYVDPLHSIREYVQNEIEAEPQPSEIRIRIDGASVSIWGDGGGMNRTMLDQAKKIGFSTKTLDEYYGFRGIGIWSGISICEKILISTKRKEENIRYILKIEASKLNEERKKTTDKTLFDVLRDNVSIKEVPAQNDEHGTQVRLINILEEHKKVILSEEKVEQYIREVLPVDFSKDFKYCDTILKSIKENVPSYRECNIFLNNKPIFRPPYINDLNPPESVILRDNNGKPIAFCWVCLHEDSKIIEENHSRGLRYKLKGFTVGDKELCRIWWGTTESRFLSWIFGEIHIINPDIIPDSERTDFEKNPAKDILFEKLRSEVTPLISDSSRRLSYVKGLKRKIKDLEKFPDAVKFNSESDRHSAITDLGKLIRILEVDLTNKTHLKFIERNVLKQARELIRKGKKSIENIKKVKIPETKKKTPEQESVSKSVFTKKSETIIVKEEPEKIDYISLIELLKDIEFTEESKIIIEIIEEILDDYFVEKISSEIKSRISDEIHSKLSM